MSRHASVSTVDDPVPPLDEAGRLIVRRRRILRLGVSTAVLAVVISSYLDHRQPQSKDDWQRYDRQRVVVTQVFSGDLFEVTTSTGEVVLVRLLGIYTPQPDEPGGEHCQAYSTGRLLAKRIVLMLDQPQTRDSQGRLLACLYPLDHDNFNVDMVRDGLARADRLHPTRLLPQIDIAESEARKKGRGLWNTGVTSAPTRKRRR